MSAVSSSPHFQKKKKKFSFLLLERNSGLIKFLSPGWNRRVVALVLPTLQDQSFFFPCLFYFERVEPDVTDPSSEDVLTLKSSRFDCDGVIPSLCSWKSDPATESKFESGRTKMKYTRWLCVLCCFLWKGKVVFHGSRTGSLYSHITYYVNK